MFDKDIYSGKKELFKIKLEAMKNLILNNKPIPEKWIFKRDYNGLLQKAMSDPIVLQYAIINANHLRNQACPEHIPKQSHTIPQKRYIISNPQIYFANRRKNPIVKHIHKFRKNNSEQSMIYNHSHEDNNYINKLKLKHNKSQDFNIKNKNTDFLLTSIAEKELELPLI